MAATGERYTAARRALLGSPADERREPLSERSRQMSETLWDTWVKRCDEAATAAVLLAQRLAFERGSDAIELPDLLEALVRVGGAAADLMHDAAIDDLRSPVTNVREVERVPRSLAWSADAKRWWEYLEVRQWGDEGQITTDKLLIPFLLSPAGRQALADAKVDPLALRERIRERAHDGGRQPMA